MDQVTSEEIVNTAKNIGFFFAQLKAHGIPEELAFQLTRDYFNHNLSWDDGEGSEEEAPTGISYGWITE